MDATVRTRDAASEGPLDAVPAPDAPSLSVVIPATDQPATLNRCLEAIGRAADAPDEVVVVDGPLNTGPAAARNAGAVRATGSILVFVDSDVLVHPDAFTRIRAAFARDPEIVAVFGSYDDRPSAHGTVSTFRNTLHHYVHHSAPGRATTFWAGLGAVRRESFLAVDGFDDALFRLPSVEDIDLGLRLSAVGGQIELDPSIQGTHLKHWRLGSMVVTDVLRRGAPWTALVLGRGAPAARLNLSGRHLLAAAAFTAGIGTAALGRSRALVPMAATYLATNARFYRLLLARDGPATATAGVALLAVHNAAALASAPLGVATFLVRRRSPPRATTHRLAALVHPDDRPAGPTHSANGSRPATEVVRCSVPVRQRSVGG